jgi:hypothetical protein
LFTTVIKKERFCNGAGSGKSTGKNVLIFHKPEKNKCTKKIPSLVLLWVNGNILTLLSRRQPHVPTIVLLPGAGLINPASLSSQYNKPPA